MEVRELSHLDLSKVQGEPIESLFLSVTLLPGMSKGLMVEFSLFDFIKNVYHVLKKF